MQGRPVSASQLEKLALCRPGLVATREAYERQIETREPGFLIRKAQLEATPGLLPPRPLSGPQEREGAEARVIAGVSLGFHLQIDAAAMEAALGGWDEGTPCVLRVEFSAGSSGKAHLLQGMFPSSGRGMGTATSFAGRVLRCRRPSPPPWSKAACPSKCVYLHMHSLT